MSRHLNLPNLLTLSRLLSIPPLAVLLLASFPHHDEVAAGAFLIFSLTDTLDGQIARRLRLVTELGKFLDPLTDKLFILAVLVVLVQAGRLSAWIVLVIFGREMLITVLRSVAASQGHVISATPFGKTKTVTQIGAVLLVILQRPHPALAPVANAALGVAVLFTVASGLDYLWRFRHVFARSPAPMPAAAGGGAPGSESQVSPLARALGDSLDVRGLTLALAESCTGGLVSALISDRPGSSAYLAGAVVSYSNEVKERLLGVPHEVLVHHGAVSAEVAVAMARGVRELLGTDLGASITGIAGPEGGTDQKPVGLTFIAVATARGVEVREHRFEGDRWGNRRNAADETLTLLIEQAGRLDGRTPVR